MTSSDRRGPRQVPPPPGGEAATSHPYARFIPREEIRTVAAWSPLAIGPERRSANGDRRRANGDAPPEPPPPDPAAEAAEAARAAERAQEVQAARHAGYQDGYRDGLVALESFKQSYAQQVTAQVGQLFDACAAQLDALQPRLADTVAEAALRLARLVVRDELRRSPEVVVAVARDAIEALAAGTRAMELHLHPDDQALVAQGAAELLERRRVQLVADPAVERGGCRLVSPMGDVDATIAERWTAAVARLDRADVAWRDADDAPGTGALAEDSA